MNNSVEEITRRSLKLKSESLKFGRLLSKREVVVQSHGHQRHFQLWATGQKRNGQFESTSQIIIDKEMFWICDGATQRAPCGCYTTTTWGSTTVPQLVLAWRKTRFIDGLNTPFLQLLTRVISGVSIHQLNRAIRGRRMPPSLSSNKLWIRA